jgi:hypothetical protein
MSTSSTWSAADHGVGHGLPLRHAGDLLDHVVERLEVLDVDGGDDVDARPQQLLHVLPALLVGRAGHVGVRQFVHECDLRLAGEHRGEVHLLERGAAIGQRGPGDHLQAVDQRGGLRAAVCLHEGDDHVGAALGAPVPLAEHRVRLADACRAAEVDPEVTRSELPIVSRISVLSTTSLPRWPRPEVTAGARFLRARGLIPGAGISGRGRC